MTRSEYAQFLAACNHPKPPQWDDPNFSDPEQPVVATSWFDATGYCDWLSRIDGTAPTGCPQKPSGKARRAEVSSRSSFRGETSLLNRSRITRCDGKQDLNRSGRAEKNAYGLCDIGANVHEWCSDWFQADYYAVSSARNPKGPAAGSRRASRGGSWRHYTKVSRCAARSSIPPEFQYADYGFRVARDL